MFCYHWLRLFYCFAWVLLPWFLPAQEKPVELVATISDWEGVPIVGVNVYPQGEQAKGTATDQQGHFKLTIARLPVTLVFSHLNYDTKTLHVDSAHELPDTIFLQAIIQALPDVVVRAQAQIDTLYPKPHSVTDYAFYQNYLVLLTCKNSIQGFSLILLDEEGKELQDYSLRHLRPKSLYRSCTESLFLITGNNVWKISIHDNRLKLGKAIARDHFSDGLTNCTLATDSLVYFHRYFYQGQALQYFVRSRHTLENVEHRFPLIEDEKNIVLLIEESGCRLPRSGNQWEEGVADKLKNLREGQYALRGMMKIFYPLLYAPLFPRDSLLCIFNHVDGELQYLNQQGEFLYPVTIEYHQHKKWKKQIYYDHYLQKAYTAFDTKEGLVVWSVDMDNGRLGSASAIPMPFIENIKVWNGHLYYLYRNRGRQERNRLLHRVKLN